MSARVLRYVGQAVAYGAFIWVIAALSDAAYQHLPEDQATVKLSLRHAGKLVSECRERTTEEMANLPANMRAPLVCPRERSALVLELDIDGERVVAETLAARGMHSDGLASVYRRLSVPAGQLTVTVRMNDDVNVDGFPYEDTQTVDLEPADVLLIDFNNAEGRFEFM